MSFYQRYRSQVLPVVIRQTEGGVLVGRGLEIEVDFMCETLSPHGVIVPEDALARLDHAMRELFNDKLLIDNSDPYADDLVKLKRIGAADPVLFEHGTSGPQLSFYVGRWLEDWLKGEKWNPADPDDVRHTTIALASVKLGRDEFFYDLV
jgi:hypothetical protein